MDGQRSRFYNFGSFRIDTTERLLLRDGEPVPLAPKVYDTLLTLVENGGRVVEKEELMKAVWPDTFVEDANLTVNISALRKALGEGVSEHQYIETVPRRGYRFVSTVTRANDESPDLLLGAIGDTPAGIDDTGTVETERKESGDRESYPPPSRSSETLPRSRSFRPAVFWLSALLVGLSGIAYYAWPERAEPQLTVRSIAVLPFKPLVADSRDELLEIGMCDALITRLGGLNHLVVRPTSSVVRYNKGDHDPLAAGRELGVDALLEGYVQRSGEKIRVTVQLLRVRDGRHLWSGRFDDNFTNIFAVEDSISRQIADALLLELTGEEQSRIAKHHTENIEAYQLYLKGRYFQDKRELEGIKKSIGYFQQAIEKDPSYALAFAGLADSYGLLVRRADMPSPDSYENAKTAAMRALEIDDTIAEAHKSLANILYWYDWNWSEAESEYIRAIDLSPNAPTVHAEYASYLLAMGRHQEALSEITRARELDSVSLVVNAGMGRVLFFARKYDEAIEQCQNTVELDPSFGGAHLVLGRAYKQKQMYAEALTALQRAKSLSSDSPEVVALIGYTYAVSGRHVEASKILEELQVQSKERYVSPYYPAMVYAGLGERDKAFDWLEKAFEEREGRMTILKIAPEFDSLRSDPRFASLVRRVGLP